MAKAKKTEAPEETQTETLEQAKSWYSLPEHGFSVEATSHVEAVKIAQKKIAENKSNG